MNQWRVLDFTLADGTLHSSRGRIEFCADTGEVTQLPVADIAVVLLGHTVSIAPAVLYRLLDADVVVLVCDWKGVPVGCCYPQNQHGRVGARHKAQAELSVPRRKNAWARLIRAKISGQAATLETLGRRGYGAIYGYAKKVRSGDPDNVEAQAARAYWPLLFGDPTFRRLAGAKTQGHNACLDYGYTVLRGYCIRATMQAGLSPTLGLFHHGRGNPNNLVDDLMEPFRPAVDLVVASFKESPDIAQREVRRQLAAAANQPFTDNGYRIPAAMTDLAQQLGNYAEGKSERLNVPIWRGPPDSAAQAGRADEVGFGGSIVVSSSVRPTSEND